MSEKLRRLESKTVVLPTENIDTDQIYPGRFLTVTTQKGLGEMLFADWRAKPDFALNQGSARGARVLVAGRNFGCGSSREHAVWALADHGIRAVISTEIADIFRRNAIKNGVVPIVLDAASHARLVGTPGQSVVIDLDKLTVSLPGGGEARFPLEPFARYCLMEGVDELTFLLSHDAAIREYEQRMEG
jgi:3-isopropylmalate/(R)-2-methylmalate dehydratase small subunit